MEEKTTAFFSSEYDEKILKTLPYYKDFINQTIEVIKASKTNSPLSWLDIGCGTGLLAKQVLKELSVDRLVLDDVNEHMLKLAKERLSNEKTDISYVQIPSQHISYKQEFDVISSIQVHHYLTREERKQATRNCFQALKKDGIYITFENYAPSSEEGVRNAKNRWRAYQLSQGRQEEEVEEHLSRYGVDYFPITLDEHRKLMKDTGFRIVELCWLSYMQAGFWAMR